MPDEAKALARTRLEGRLKWVDGELAGRSHLMGELFTVADAYLFVVLGWSKYVGMDLSALTQISAFIARVAARPGVQGALRSEGLLA
jgi:glutathione S-transferase